MILWTHVHALFYGQSAFPLGTHAPAAASIVLICMWIAEVQAWFVQAKGELWTRSWETMPLPLSQAAEATPASRPAAAPASWLAQHRAAKSSSLSAKPTLATSRKNRWRPWLTGYVLTCLLCLLCQPSAEWRVARAAVLS